MTATLTEQPLITVGQDYEAIARRMTSPQGIGWEYPYGYGNITVLGISEAGEPTEYGIRSYDAVWYSFEGSTEVEAISPEYFLQSFRSI
jgi:hypothetical protein